MGTSQERRIFQTGAHLSEPDPAGAVWSLETPDKKSITIERMALFGLKELINAKEIEDPGLLPFCESLLKDYESYDIHIDGAEGILSSLIGNVHIRDRQMYQYLYGIKKTGGCRRIGSTWIFRIKNPVRYPNGWSRSSLPNYSASACIHRNR